MSSVYTPDVMDIARYLKLEACERDKAKSMKLMAFAQAYYLRTVGRPLFVKGTIKKYPYGPIVEPVLQLSKHTLLDQDGATSLSNKLPDEIKECLDVVCSVFHDLRAADLMDETHESYVWDDERQCFQEATEDDLLRWTEDSKQRFDEIDQHRERLRNAEAKGKDGKGRVSNDKTTWIFKSKYDVDGASNRYIPVTTTSTTQNK